MIESKSAIRIIFLLLLFLIIDFVGYGGSTLNALNYLPASRLIKLADEPTVYYVNQNRQKMPIPSAEVFLSYGAKWEDIEIVKQVELDFYKNAEYIKLIGNARVYFLEDGVKRYLTQKAASALKIFPEEVIPVNRTEINAYKSGQTLDEEEALALRARKDAAVLSQEQNQECVPDESVGGEDGCQVFEAMEAKDASLCSAISSVEWQARCYSSIVPENQDYLANCNKIVDENLKDNCVSQAALAKKNALLCANISGLEKKQFCESGVGISQRDITACDSLAEGDAVLGKNSCLYMFAVSNADSRACEKLSADSTYKKSCEDSLTQQFSMLKKLKSNLLSSAPRKILSSILGHPASAQTDPTNIPVGGRFLPGLFDIFTPTPVPPCLLVSVVGPNPGVFNFVPIAIYDYFPAALSHISLNMLGLSKVVPPCPPTLFMLGSGLTPF